MRRSRVTVPILIAIVAGLVLSPSMASSAPGPAPAPDRSAALALSATDGTYGVRGSCNTRNVAKGVDGKAIVATISREATQRDLTSVLFRVTKRGKLIASGAIGHNVTGVPLQQSVQFRNGNVAFGYLGILLLKMAQAGQLNLDDPVGRWLPDLKLPNADTVTLRMLVRNTSGYPDYVTAQPFVDAFLTNPFREFSLQQLLDYAFARKPLYTPGTAWSYAHTNYLLLSRALEAAGGQPLGQLMTNQVIKPMGLTNTKPVYTPEVPNPPLHTYSNERGQFEETTFWNPSWQTARGAVLATTICDMVKSARAVGTGKLLTRPAFQTFISDDPVEHRPPPAGCPTNVCHQFPQDQHYALGVLVTNGWIIQNPLFAGQGGLHAYLPHQDLAIAIVTVAGPNSQPNVNDARGIWEVLTTKITATGVPPR